MASQNTRTPPYAVTGTATGTSVAVDLTYLGDGRTLADYISIQNTDAAGGDNLLLSFDDTTFVTIAPGNAFDLEWRLKTIYLKSSGAGTNYEIVCTTGKQFRTAMT